MEHRDYQHEAYVILSMESKIVKFCLVLWLMLFYGIAHGDIAKILVGKYSGICEMISSALMNSNLLLGYTAVLMTGATIWLASRNYDNWHFSWNKLYLELGGIEVLWFIPYDWKVCSIGLFPISLFHYGAILVIALIVADIVRWMCNHNEILQKAKDIPYTIDTTSDELIDEERALYADNILARLQAVENESESYAIIVFGEWGAGKTVFLNYIERILRDKQREALIFNPWKCQTPQQVNTDFLSLLSELLKKYDSSLEKPFIRYSEMLDSMGVPKGIGFLLNLFARQEKMLTETKTHLEKSLSQIRVPVYILIDDLDRMDADEILAVVRLIRNTANFPYLKFIVMSDRAYLLGKLQERNISPEYLQKIFMAEFYLPSICSEYPCVDACWQDMKEMTDDIFVKDFFSNLTDANSEIIEKSLLNIRQAKRFARELVTDWDFAKKNKSGKQYEILFHDYFWIELLKYTDLRHYQKLEHNPTELFDVALNSRYNVNMYVLKKDYLSEEHKGKLWLQILRNVFRYKDDGSTTFRSASLVENFDKYFSFGKSASHLSHSDYIELLHHNGSKEELYRKVEAMSNNRLHSLKSLVVMTKPQKQRAELQKRYLDIFFALCSRFTPNSVELLVKQMVNTLLDYPVYADAVKAYLQEKLKESKGHYEEIILSNSICRHLILPDNQRQPFFNKDELKVIVKDNFDKYLSLYTCDAADILKKNSELNHVVTSSVLNYPMKDEEGNYLYTDYNCLVFTEIINHFEQHKSNNRLAIEDFEDLNMPEDLPQSEYNAAAEDKQEEIASLFGSFGNYEKFKELCFEG